MYIYFITYSEVLVLSLKPLTQLPSCDLAVLCVYIAALSFVRASVSSSAMPIIAVALHARGAVLAHVALHRGCHAQEPAAIELVEDDDGESSGLTQTDQDR